MVHGIAGTRRVIGHTAGQVAATRATIEVARVRAVALFAAPLIGGLSVAGAFAGSATGAITFVAAQCVAALVTLIVAIEHPRQSRAWRLVGVGVTLFAVAGFLMTLIDQAGFTSIPMIVPSLICVLGYLPVMAGLGELCDPQLRARRLTSVADGVLLFLTIYAVLWLIVVEPVAVGSALPKVDRAFDAIYPAGDLALLMLAVRIAISHVARRRVATLLVGSGVLATGGDVAKLVLYLTNPSGSYPLTVLAHLLSLGGFALAAVWSLLPAPPPVPAGATSSRWLALMVAVSSLLPPLALLGVVWFTDRRVSLAPVAMWVLLAVGAAVARHVASVRELERSHQQSVWLASHDLTTDMLYRSAFLHEVSAGSMRDRSGTVLVVEILGLPDLRDCSGYDVADHVVTTVANRLHMAAGEGAVLGRLADNRFAAFIRSTELARGRQIASALQRTLLMGTTYGDTVVDLPAVVGVAQADGAVIDAEAGVRRATDAARVARNSGVGTVAVDADLTGAVVSPALPNHPSRREPLPAS